MQEKLEQLEKKYCVGWREYEIGELFEIISGKQPELSNRFDKKEKGMVNTITGATTENGINFYSYSEKNYNNELTISKDGAYAGTVFYQSQPFILGGHVLGIFSKKETNKNFKTYVASLINKIRPIWMGYDRPTVPVSKFEKVKITLPTVNNEIAFTYIDEFINTLETERLAMLNEYLLATGLKDVELNSAEHSALDKLGTDSVSYMSVKFNVLFNHIQQGKRLKKSDQLDGDIPFVMAGTTNTGIVKYISNPVRSFPKNSLTIDIFGNTFYRDYEFGAGDDTGVFWNDNNKFSKNQMLFLSTVINLFLVGKYDFGYKLRASQTSNFEISLPMGADGNIDYNFMTNLMSAIQKHVIKDVVKYLDNRIEAINQIIKED